MVNDLRALMRENVSDPPPDHLDPQSLVGAGQRRVRHRRAAVAGTAALVVVGAFVITTVVGQAGTKPTRPTQDPPTPTTGKLLHLGDADPAVAGRDYRVLASNVNDNLNRDNGQYFDGVTDDGLVLFRDGPRRDQPRPRMALLDPTTGDKDWLPDSSIAPGQTLPVELGADRLMFASLDDFVIADGMPMGKVVASLFDRRTRQWRNMKWPSLPSVDEPRAALGPDGRLYVLVAATNGEPPQGGWPTGPDGDAEDADAQGDTYRLWSASLTDTDDVRDEALTVGDLAFTDTSMVWTDATNGDPGMIHTRDLSTGKENSFDPHTGERCNLLSFGATEKRVVLSQYCGTYAGGARDDRVQILTSDGGQVVTIQDNGIEGAIAGLGGANDLVTVSSSFGRHGGAYVYDLSTGQFLRLSNAVSRFTMGGPAPAGQLLWHTPLNHRKGATQWLGQIVE